MMPLIPVAVSCFPHILVLPVAVLFFRWWPLFPERECRKPPEATQKKTHLSLKGVAEHREGLCHLEKRKITEKQVTFSLLFPSSCQGSLTGMVAHVCTQPFSCWWIVGRQVTYLHLYVLHAMSVHQRQHTHKITFGPQDGTVSSSECLCQEVESFLWVRLFVTVTVHRS